MRIGESMTAKVMGVTVRGYWEGRGITVWEILAIPPGWVRRDYIDPERGILYEGAYATDGTALCIVRGGTYIID
jgi:hypothetical protein